MPRQVQSLPLLPPQVQLLPVLRAYLLRRSGLVIQRYYHTFLALNTCKYLSSNLYNSIVQIQAMMDLIHTPPATDPTQSQLDDALGLAEELQGHLSQVERERDSRIQELETRYRELETRAVAFEREAAGTRLEADSLRRVPSFFYYFSICSCYLLVLFIYELFSDTVFSFVTAERSPQPADTGLGGTDVIG